ncbi:hypothetical protein ACFPFV_11455 [Salinicoccus siamensis]|uniref:hypothetical protein n=1 Tax=Salinicoccus siamensis TaxID=381830 RepID=UPI003619152E
MSRQLQISACIPKRCCTQHITNTNGTKYALRTENNDEQKSDRHRRRGCRTGKRHQTAARRLSCRDL